MSKLVLWEGKGWGGKTIRLSEKTAYYDCMLDQIITIFKLLLIVYTHRVVSPLSLYFLDLIIGYVTAVILLCFSCY